MQPPLSRCRQTRLDPSRQRGVRARDCHGTAHFRAPYMARIRASFKGLTLDGELRHDLCEQMGPGESPAISPPRDEAPP